jgi:hypothetical protein
MQPYPSQYPPVQPMAPRTSTNAIISLIGSIAGISLLPILGSIVGIICGHMAKSEIKRSAGMVTGNGLATAGLIIGYLTIALGLCILCIAVLFPILGIGLSLPFIGNTTY